MCQESYNERQEIQMRHMLVFVVSVLRAVKKGP